MMGLSSEDRSATICETCGTGFPLGSTPSACPICEDERQYVGHEGQRWTTLGTLEQAGYRNLIQDLESGLTGVGTEPKFAIGQRALLVQTAHGNVLWDCITYVDDRSLSAIKALGGIDVIAISHPHYHASMVSWSRAFGGVPILLHEAVRPWVVREDPAIQFWKGSEYPLFGGITLVRVGGHFEGSQVAHWADGAEGRGALLTGDQPHVCADRRWVTFMYSYPNYIPLPARQVNSCAAALAPFAFDRLYGAWWDTVIHSGAHAAVARSAERYVRAVSS